VCVSAKRPKESDNSASKQTARQDMPQGFTGEPFVYEPENIKTTAVPWVVFLLVFTIGCLIIQLKFNDLNVQHIIRTWGIIIAALLIMPLHELAHGAACYLLTKPHRCPRFDKKCWKRFLIYFYTYLPAGAFLSKHSAITALLAPLLLVILPMLICLFPLSYEWIVSLSIFFVSSAALCENDIDHVIMLYSEEDSIVFANRHGYDAIYPR